jgi:3'-phosphoadenosine 5'-phosphosulfate synthase
MELIDEGETDHKIIVIRSTDKHFDRIHSVEDLDKYKPGVIDNLVDWLKNYKTSDGKPVNRLAQEEPTSAAEAMDIIEEVSEFYDDLISGKVELEGKEEDFYWPAQ